jgi:5-formyltetrahydrofolate cyclo-ligase
MRMKRDQIAAPIIYKVCQAIYERVIAWNVFQAAPCVACYVSVQNEVDTRQLIEYALRVGKKVFVPVTQGSGVMGFQEILSLDNLRSARFGLLEPEHDVGLMIEPDDLDLVIVPGIAFDRRGNRLGFGGGYYDRFFERCNATRVGLAYAFQVVDDIPAEDHDEKMDWVVTEDEVILCRAKK